MRVRRLQLLLLACIGAALASPLSTEPASAITAELAKKCRQLALEAHPPVRAGTKAGTSAEFRAFYQSCLANNGTPPSTGAKAGSGSPPQQSGSSPAPPAKPQ